MFDGKNSGSIKNLQHAWNLFAVNDYFVNFFRGIVGFTPGLADDPLQVLSKYWDSVDLN